MSDINQNLNELAKEVQDNPDIPDADKVTILKNLQKIKNQKINIMITGATGSGKSSTINALFNAEKAKVGMGVDPETMDIQKYELDNLILWDSPGLGDGKEKDRRHSKNIIDLLYRKDDEGNALIDLVLVILDGGSRDLGTSYELINQVIIPALGKNAKDRILVAINQCDMAMKGRGWDRQANKPEPELESFLKEKVNSVKRRIYEATGVDIEPIYYSAGYQDKDGGQRPYNLSKLLWFIVKYTPAEKRIHIAQNMSKDEEVWKDDDELEDYNKKTQQSFLEAIVDSALRGAEKGATIGAVFGGPAGAKIGGMIGAAVGAGAELVSRAWDKLTSWW